MIVCCLGLVIVYCLLLLVLLFVLVCVGAVVAGLFARLCVA